MIWQANLQHEIDNFSARDWNESTRPLFLEELSRYNSILSFSALLIGHEPFQVQSTRCITLVQYCIIPFPMKNANYFSMASSTTIPLDLCSPKNLMFAIKQLFNIHFQYSNFHAEIMSYHCSIHDILNGIHHPFTLPRSE